MQDAAEIASDDEVKKRTEFLFGECRKFCDKLGLPADYIVDIYKADDWRFCVLSASILESVLNEILHRGLKFEARKGQFVEDIDFSSFVERLPMLGRAGRHALAKICGASKEDLDFLECLFLVRNAFVHDVRNANKSLFEMVMNHPEKPKLLRGFNVLANDPESKHFLKIIEQHQGMLKFAVFDQMQKFIALANLMNANR
jgi:hypothetical protein